MTMITPDAPMRRNLSAAQIIAVSREIPMIQVKRAYEERSDSDGERFLVDRLWPRGVTKSALAIAAWLKEAAPSNELRKWYGHEPAKWGEFRRRYFADLEKVPEAWQPLVEAARRGTITLVYSSQEKEINNAVALKEFVEKKLKKAR
jgi:uncharacterized protein YeaO (DUF488 family)